MVSGPKPALKPDKIRFLDQGACPGGHPPVERRHPLVEGRAPPVEGRAPPGGSWEAFRRKGGRSRGRFWEGGTMGGTRRTWGRRFGGDVYRGWGDIIEIHWDYRVIRNGAPFKISGLVPFSFRKLQPLDDMMQATLRLLASTSASRGMFLHLSVFDI